ncbi:MAG: class I SAM-dependent methyltransferase [Ktedonobacterales bacterium]|nr:class I SAM-dependent methyltransferase [Ktedonobacterales bacterium]
MTEPRARDVRSRALAALFGLLYRNRVLYWLASTIPFAGQWRRWQRLVLPRLARHDVLEVGCGTGTLLADLVAAGYACAAIDRSPPMVAAARRRLRRRGHPLTAARIQRADVRHLPFATAAFDDVVSTFPTDYITDLMALGEIARVLRPGGRFIVVLGAELLPTHPLVLPLVGLQRLVYGRRGAANCANGVGAALPLAAVGLVGHEECVRGPFWLARLVLAEKPD